MKHTSLSLLFLGLATACSSSSSSSSNSASGVSYYVDSVSGSDANAGTSSSAPWNTLAHAVAAQPSSGSTIYLKRGDTWNEQLVLPGSGITVDAYGSGALPIIDGSRSFSGTWTSEGSGIYSQTASLASGEALGNITENGTMMTFVAWSSNVTTTFSGAATTSFSFDYSANKVYIKPSSTPSGNSYLISVKMYGIDAESRTDISINNVSITRFSLHGIQFQNCVRCYAKNVTISSGGGAVIGTNTAAPPTYLYAGNGIQFGNTSSSGLVDSCTISQIFDSGVSPQTFSSSQTMSSITIQNSTIDKCGFAGVEISLLSNGGTTGSSIMGITLSGLTITNSGHGWSAQRYSTEAEGIRIKADSGAGSMSGISVQTTSVSGGVGDGILLAGELGTVSIGRAKLTGNHYGVNVTDTSSTTLKLNLSSSLIYGNASYGVYYNAPTAAGFSLLQNTFYNNTTINFGIFNQTGTAQLENNIFYSSAAMTHLYVASTLTGATINNNCYNNLSNMFGYNSATYASVATFNTASSFESHGLGGTVALNNPSSADFTLQSTSQCRSLGASGLGIILDYSGYSYASTPDSGAYQYH